jgi:hypothetical protein
MSRSRLASCRARLTTLKKNVRRRSAMATQKNKNEKSR